MNAESTTPKGPAYGPGITEKMWQETILKWAEYVITGRTQRLCLFCELFSGNQNPCQGCPLISTPAVGADSAGCCEGKWGVWQDHPSPENAQAVFQHILAKYAEWVRWQATEPTPEPKAPEPLPPEPEPCLKCGAAHETRGGMPAGESAWVCGSVGGSVGEGESFLQSIGCRRRQLEAACEANGTTADGWPVVVGEPAFIRSVVHPEVAARVTIDAICSSGQIGVANAQRYVSRRSSELWHSPAEAEAALAKGGR